MKASSGTWNLAGGTITVLDCDGSYPGPGGAASGYLVEASGVVIWLEAGPGWSPEELGTGIGLLLCEATYTREHEGEGRHLSGRQAGAIAAGAGVRRLVLTLRRPSVAPTRSRGRRTRRLVARCTRLLPAGSSSGERSPAYVWSLYAHGPHRHRIATASPPAAPAGLHRQGRIAATASPPAAPAGLHQRGCTGEERDEERGEEPTRQGDEDVTTDIGNVVPDPRVLRADGRALDELRPVTFQRDFTEFAPGSVLLSMGRTKVLCTASVEDRVPPWMRGSGKGWVTAEYSMLPGSTSERATREASKGKQSGRTQEIQRLIGRSLRAVCDLVALGELQVTVDCDVLQADGGTRTASICGAYVALHDAFSRFVAAGRLKVHPLGDAVAAVSVGIVDGVPMLDLPYAEDSRAEVDMNVVMTGSGRFVEVQGTAEGLPFSRSELDELLVLAEAGISRLLVMQDAVLAEPPAPR